MLRYICAITFLENSKIINTSSDTFFDDTIVMLGTFRTIMNLLGCIGYIVMKSGFNDLYETIYGQNA